MCYLFKVESPVIVVCTAINKNYQKCIGSGPVADQGFDLRMTVKVLVVLILF